MAAVTTHGLEDYDVYNKKDPPNLAPGLDEIGKLGFAREHYVQPNELGVATLTDNTPISFQPQAAVTSHGIEHSFLQDYYYRIHINPSTIALGNLLSAQSRNVEVWNSYFNSKLLSSLGQSGTGGITLTQPAIPPITFAALEAHTYVLNISTDGSTVINALYTFNFPDESPTLAVTGRRVVVWPFMPQTRHNESLEWKTDLIPTFNNEQRLALRPEPRQEFTYDFQLDEYQFSRAKAITTRWAHRVYGIAAWAETTYVGALSAGATAVFFDTVNADYRANDIFLIWESDTKFEAVENVEVLADRVNLVLPLENDYTDAYVAPMRFARTLRGINYRRRSNVYATARGTFLVTQNVDLGATVGYDTYRSKDVIPDQTIIVSDPRERISRAVDMFDNGSGPITVEIKNSWVNSTKMITFDTDTRAQRWAARQWIHSRRGRQKAFWLPSWNRDLNSLVDVSAAATSLTCSPIGYPLYYGVKDIMIQLTDGSRYYNRVLSATTDGNGDEILSLESAVGVDLPVADIDMICFMSHVRFDTDKVDIRHDYAGRAVISIPVKETPE